MLAAVHKVLKIQDLSTGAEGRWTFVSTDRSGTERALEAPAYDCVEHGFFL